MPPPEFESDNPLRALLLQYVLQRPFIPFSIRLEGGFEVPVPHHEFATVQPGVLTMLVYDSSGGSEFFSTDRIVSLRLSEAPLPVD